MYTLVKELGLKKVFVEEAPYLLASLVVAELFFKWGSFSLELIGFFVMWAISSFIGNGLREIFKGNDALE